MTKNKQSTATPSEVTKRQLYAKLAKLGIASVTIGYSGSCDSGCIESVTALGPDKLEVKLPARVVAIDLVSSSYDCKQHRFVNSTVRRKVPLGEAIENWCYDLLAEHFPGWEINDGADGTITLDVVQRAATLQHDEKVIQTNSHTVKV